METDFQDLVYSQRAALALKTSRTAAMSSANGILTILKAWNGLGGPDEVFSMGVLCSGTVEQLGNPNFSLMISLVLMDLMSLVLCLGHFDLPDGIVFSVPVTFKERKWSVFPHVTIGDELDERLQLFVSEIQEVHQGIKFTAAQMFCCYFVVRTSKLYGCLSFSGKRTCILTRFTEDGRYRRQFPEMRKVPP